MADLRYTVGYWYDAKDMRNQVRTPLAWLIQVDLWHDRALLARWSWPIPFVVFRAVR